MNIHFAGTFMLCKNVSGMSLQVLRDFPHVLANLYDFLIHSRFGKNGFHQENKYMFKVNNRNTRKRYNISSK